MSELNAAGPPGTRPIARRAPQSWVFVLALFVITSVVESVGISQIFAFMPLYLSELGLPKAEIPHWVGVLSALVFVLGLPLVPMWGVWADKYSRKAVIIRSALVNTLVFGFVALSREPWQLGASFMLAGFQLGNSGVMLSALRDITPKQRLGTAIALFGASSPVGFAVGPALGGLMVDHLHTSLTPVYALSAMLSLGTAVMLGVGFREVRPAAIPTAPSLTLAYGAMRSVFTDGATRRLFALFGMALLARQMAQPFQPLVVEHANGSLVGLASAIALVVGTAGLVGGLISPVAGAVGDRIGFRPVLAVALLGTALGFSSMPFAPNVPVLAVIGVFNAALNASVGAMIMGLLAVEVPPEQRSTTLNLVYLPLYLSGIVGPAIGAVVVAAGLPVVFGLAGLVLGLAGLHVLSELRQPGSQGTTSLPAKADR